MTTDAQPTVLLVEDSLTFAEIYQTFLEKEPVDIIHVQTGTDALTHIQQTVPDVILLDLGHHDMNGMEILKHVQQQQLGCAVIVITAQDAVEVVVEAMRYGAFDFLDKPIKEKRLIVTLQHALRQHKLVQTIDFYHKNNLRKHYHDFIGACEPMQALYQNIERVAGSDVPVFITGESGTGKELCAKAIHKESKRKDKPFFALNCAAISENLMESEIFGHVKGGFTGADKNRDGAASAADGGTLFLDEVGDMDLELQTKLLRFVETGTFYKVGSSQLQKVDIRLISATHRHIPAEIEAERFREDLHYRLRVVSIKLPPLRERGQDVLLLARAFLGKFATVGHQFKGFTSEADDFLLNYQWRGNVRQLQHVIHNVVVLNDGEMITASMLRAALDEEPNETNEISIAETATEKKMRPLWQVEKDAIIETLDFCNGDVIEAANLLEIGTATVYRKLNKYSIAFKRTVKSS